MGSSRRKSRPRRNDSTFQPKPTTAVPLGDTGSTVVDALDLYGRTPEESIRETVQSHFKVAVKPQQAEAIRKLAFTKKDLILIAKTGFGKSIVILSLPFLLPLWRRAGLVEERAIALIILPLKLLQEQQSVLVASIPNGKPFVLQGGIGNTPENRARMGNGEFTHGQSTRVVLSGSNAEVISQTNDAAVFVSPEIAVSDVFNKQVLKQEVFWNQLRLVAIDEVHLATEWHTFRHAYTLLHTLKDRVHEHVPFFGSSATLDKASVTSVKTNIGFTSDVEIMRTSIDRPEVYIAMQQLQCPMTTFQDLEWILPRALSSPYQLAKTIIYIDTTSSILRALSIIRGWMKKLDYPPWAYNLVQPYYSAIAENDKARISTAFMHATPDFQAAVAHSQAAPNAKMFGCCRILLATDAYGVGIDNGDIDLVVQWTLPNSLANFYQRAGRPARRSGRTGTFLLLYEEWNVGPVDIDIIKPADAHESDSQGTNLRFALNAEADEQALSDSQEEPKSLDEIGSDSEQTPDSRQTQNAQDESGKEPDARNTSVTPKAVGGKARIVQNKIRRKKLPLELYTLVNTRNCLRLYILGFFDDTTYSESQARPEKCCSNCDPIYSPYKPPQLPVAKRPSADNINKWWRRDALEQWRQARASQLDMPASIVLSEENMINLARYGSTLQNFEDVEALIGNIPELEGFHQELLDILDVKNKPVYQRPKVPEPPVFGALCQWQTDEDNWRIRQGYAEKHAPKQAKIQPKSRKPAAKPQKSLRKAAMQASQQAPVGSHVNYQWRTPLTPASSQGAYTPSDSQTTPRTARVNTLSLTPLSHFANDCTPEKAVSPVKRKRVTSAVEPTCAPLQERDPNAGSNKRPSK